MHRRNLWAVLRIILGVAVLLAVGLALTQRWSAVSAELGRVPLGATLLAGGCVIGALGLTLLGWRLLLAGLGSPLPWAPAAGIFFIGQLGKYLPGSVWPIVVQAQGAARYGVPRERTAIAGLLAVLLSAWCGVLVGLGALPLLLTGVFSSTGSVGWLRLGGVQAAGICVAAAVLVALVHPGILNALVAFILRILRRPPWSQRLGGRAIFGTMLSFLVAWLLLGAHIWILARALAPEAAGSAALAQAAIFGYPLAAAVGILVIPLPVGLGLREFILVVVLAGQFAQPSAIAVGLVSRLLVTLADILVAVIGWAVAAQGRSKRTAGVESGGGTKLVR